MDFPTHIVAVGGLVTNEKDEVLLVRSERRGWEFPGGQVENGESLPQALIREIEEESGVLVKVNNLVGLYSNTSKKKGYNGVKEVTTKVMIDFLCSYVSGELKTSEETLEVGWFSKEEALKIVNYQGYTDRIKNMINFNGTIHCYAYKEPFEYIEKYLFQ